MSRLAAGITVPMLLALVACKDAPPPPPNCGAATVVLDGKPLPIGARAFGYEGNEDWTIRLFVDGPGATSCEGLESVESNVEVTAFDGQPQMGVVSYRLDAPYATGMSTDTGPGSRCKSDHCSEIDAALTVKPHAAGDAMAICTTAEVRFNDSKKGSHELRITGRLDATYCGTRLGLTK